MVSLTSAPVDADDKVTVENNQSVQPSLEFLGLGGVTLETVFGQDWAHLFLKKSDLLWLEGLPVGSHGGSTAQEDQRSNKSFSGAHHYDYVRAIRNQ